MRTEIEQKSRQEIEQFQVEKLKEQLQYLQQHSPYYKALFSSCKTPVSTIQSLDDLTEFPVTTKTDLQRQNEDFFCVDKHAIIDHSSTSGTTGTPVNFGLTDNDLTRLAHNEAQSFALAGVTSKDVVQLMTTLDRRFMAGLAYFLGLRQLGAGVIRTGAGIPALQWDAILSQHPSYIVVVPSFLLKMIEYAEQHNIQPNKSSVKAAICIGEPLRMQDFSENVLAQRIREKWDIQLYSTYASTEMGTAFTECEKQNGGHLPPDLIITEVLDNDNFPVKKGGVGELTITTLGVEGLPLFRFKTGDLLRIEDEPCACGRNTLRVGPVVGRVQQMIKYKGTTLFPPAIQEVLNSFEAIEGHIIELSTNDIGTDELIIKIVCSDDSDAFKRELKDQFRAKLRVSPTIENIDQNTYISLAYPPKSRKPRRVIDLRGQ